MLEAVIKDGTIEIATEGTTQRFVDRVEDTSTLATWEEFEIHHHDAFVERITAFIERVGS